MKRVLAIIMAMAMVLSMGITAFAAGETEPTTGSITITNATKDQTYSVYKIFDATYSKNADGTTNVTYHVKEGEPAYQYVVSEEGKKFFTYNEDYDEVNKKADVNDSELIAYLNKVVNAANGFSAVATKTTAENETTVVFQGLKFGYYLVTSTLGTGVTITSNAPDVNVIDKNQKPGGNFDKDIVVSGVIDADEKDAAAIGDRVDYQIAFQATNYDGDKHIRYYQIIDTLGSSLIADVSTFEVFVGGNKLTNGWLLNNSTATATTVAEGKIGEWSGNINEAEWYLVYLGNNQFRITLPWQSNHRIEGDTGAYTITFPEKDTEGNVIEHNSKYASPIEIRVNFAAHVKWDAPIGGGTHDALTNTANASWASANETGTTPTESVLTEVFGLGILKDDGTTGKNLANAKFRIWKNEDCTEPVHVIPTNIEGVYILDSKGSPAEAAKGANDPMLSRNHYAAYLGEAYANGKQDNLMVTPINGKIIILGLDAGTYYLEEFEAPSGYNALTAPVELKAGEGQTPFYVFADTNGKVADLRDPDGSHSRNTYNVTHTTVHNSQGRELPSTGGEGTVMLITLGSIIAMAFAVLLVTQKKMSIYKD